MFGKTDVATSINIRTEKDQSTLAQKALEIFRGVESSPLGPPRWRVSPDPFWLDPEEAAFLQELGGHLLAFYQALNDLYHQSVRGRTPGWVAHYLDLGKPTDVVAYGRMNRIKAHLPGVIRPDLILTEDGMTCTELDAVPGGFGMTACLARLYARQGSGPDGRILGGADGIVRGFAKMIRQEAGQDHPRLAIVVSEESKDYRTEMQWLAQALSQYGQKGQGGQNGQTGQAGIETTILEPSQVEFTEEGLFTPGVKAPLGSESKEDIEQRRIHIIYRFFELFDLKNVQKSDLILYGAKKGLAALTPPVKAFLEEKAAFALLHHPVLRPFWQESLGEDTLHLLERLFPKTWILDPREVPPHAAIPGLTVRGKCLPDWKAVGRLGQKDRRFVIKPSGFSPLAWGSRGVVVGHDVSEQGWQKALQDALGSFDKTPHVLQAFHKGRRVETSYYDSDSGEVQSMSGRVRLSPYYFVADGKAELAGVLATVCPLNKKILHGMKEAVMVPCGLRSL